MLLNHLSRALYEIRSTQKTNLYIYIYSLNVVQDFGSDSSFYCYRLVSYGQQVTTLQSVLMEEVPFKIVKIIFMITPEYSSRDLLMSSK